MYRSAVPVTGKRLATTRMTSPDGVWLSMIRDRLAALRPFLLLTPPVWVHLDRTMSHKAQFHSGQTFSGLVPT